MPASERMQNLFCEINNNMPSGYQIKDQSSLYFLTLQVVDWVDVFTRKHYRDVLLDSFRYCISHKGLLVWSYVIMSNHVHVIVSSSKGELSNTLRDLKRYTATQILKAINSPKESRRDWMLKRFEFMAKRHKRNSHYQFWTHENHAVLLESSHFIVQKCHYIHENPVKAGLVEWPSDYLYSSARNYEGKIGLLEVKLLDELYSL